MQCLSIRRESKHSHHSEISLFSLPLISLRALIAVVLLGETQNLSCLHCVCLKSNNVTVITALTFLFGWKLVSPTAFSSCGQNLLHTLKFVALGLARLPHSRKVLNSVVCVHVLPVFARVLSGFIPQSTDMQSVGLG